MAQQLQILWKDNHNLALLLSPPPESQRLITSAIHGFNTCKISHALRMNPVIHENLIKGFWLYAKMHKEGDGGKRTITTRVQDIEIVISETVISETVIREVMGFTDKSTDPLSLEKGVIEGVLSEMGYEEVYPMLQKKLLIPYWRYIAHVFMNRGGKYKFEGLHPLKKFGQFAEMEGVDVGAVAENPNVMIEEEHDVKVLGSMNSDDDVYVVQPPECEDVVTGYKPNLDFDFESEMEPVETESFK
ncbi:hypothetical protein R6Q59_006443 [Mikania micrantha]